MQPEGKHVNYIMIQRNIPSVLYALHVQRDCGLLFLYPDIWSGVMGTRPMLTWITCVLLNLKVVILLQMYSSYIHKRLPTLSLLLCIAWRAWELFSLRRCYLECLCWEPARCGPPSCVLMGRCGPLWALSGATSNPTSECSSASLVYPVTPSELQPSSESHVLWLNTRSWRLCLSTAAALHPSAPGQPHIMRFSVTSAANLILARLPQKQLFNTNLFCRGIILPSYLTGQKSMALY